MEWHRPAARGATMSLKQLKVHAMRDDKRALCGRIFGSNSYTGGLGQRVQDQASAKDMRVMGVDCALCLKVAERETESAAAGGVPPTQDPEAAR
jgi:hypothetical protein